MAVTFYGSAEKAADLAGVDETEITDEMIEAINSVIDSEIRTEGFTKKEVTEYYDINDNNKKQLMLKKYPVIINTLEITDNCDDESSGIVDSDNYKIDLETGIVQFKSTVAALTKGFKTVKAKYSHGFDTVPAIIIELATLLMAKYAKVKDQNGDADGLASFSAGNYNERRDLQFLNVNSEFDSMIKKLTDKAKILYYLE